MNRRGFLAASTVIAASGATPGEVVPGGTHLVERRADFDAAAFGRAVGRPAQIRQLYEAVAFRPAVLNNVKNSFNGLQFGFGYSPSTIAVALAAHGPSAVYGYGDELWGKYRLGEFFKLTDATGNPIVSNVFVVKRAVIDAAADPDDPAGMYQDTSLEMLQHRGLVVLICHTAVEEQARGLVKGGFAPAGASANDVADELLTHLIPGAVVVPAMVATIAVLQAKYRYTYLSPEL
ncbi:MAG TPA: twin-arginine translocation signal domain-containing protein [Candidatus Binatia bacterium]|nr:twin-arginine translocation signal domain-containing protein [Candidatus Binatia bacterium]